MGPASLASAPVLTLIFTVVVLVAGVRAFVMRSVFAGGAVVRILRLAGVRWGLGEGGIAGKASSLPSVPGVPGDEEHRDEDEQGEKALVHDGVF